MYDVIVLGMGAGGLFALAHVDKTIHALGIEKNKTAGNKLCITGGGRCNLTAQGNVKDFVQCYTHPSFVRPIIYGFNNDALVDYFKQRGLGTKVEKGKILPISEKARDVRDFFLKEIQKKGHGIQYDREITEIKRHEEFIELISDQGSFVCKKLIFACGGGSYPQTGSDGTLMKKTFEISELEPGLCALYVKFPSSGYTKTQSKKSPNSIFQSLEGITLDVSLQYGKRTFDGSLLLSGSLLTGPAILNLSNGIQEGDIFHIDFLPCKTKEELERELLDKIKTNPKKLVKTLFVEALDLPERFIIKLLQEESVDTVKGAEISHKELSGALDRFKKYKVQVDKKAPLERAAVSKGGVKIEELDNKTMEWKKDRKIMVIGEAIESVGHCGGYNLQFAFSSAYRAARVINTLFHDKEDKK